MTNTETGKAHRAPERIARKAFEQGATILISDKYTGQDRHITMHATSTTHTRDTTTWDELTDQVATWSNRNPGQHYYIAETNDDRDRATDAAMWAIEQPDRRAWHGYKLRAITVADPFQRTLYHDANRWLIGQHEAAKATA